MNACLSIKRRSGRVTSAPYYQKTCRTDEKRRQLPSACAGEALNDCATNVSAVGKAITALTVVHIDIPKLTCHEQTSLVLVK